ncbi:MAG: glycine oxidase ThiO [Acidobacteria bacterium]|nr:glycine oxidase ThiO [Acidobacteriota bacterium]
MQSYDAIVVGGGIIGCSIARALSDATLKIAVIERGAPGEEASWAAAGMLAPSAEAQAGSVLFPACRASLKLYESFAAELQAETGIDSQYRTEGTLLLYENEHERETMLESVEWQRQQGILIRELSTQDLHNAEPQLAPCPGGFYLPEDHQVDNRLLMRALIQSCERRGVRFQLGEGARAVQHNGTTVNGVSVGADNIAAPRVVNTAGAWAGAISVPGRRSAPIRPVKGHMIALANPQPPLRHVVRTHRVYLVPRRNGLVMVGSTMEEAGFDKTPRAGPIAKLLRAAQHLCPILEQSAISEFWAGLRPAAPDGLPVLGPSALDGYWLATGHFRNGILLTPITAQILSSWLLTGSSSFAVDALLPRRFENISK